MASSTAATSPEGRSKKYDVFISFRGEDTRKNFLSHLHGALCRKKLKTFVDEGLDKGDEISLELIRAIEESYVSLIIFSKNYASSRWCLDELTKIIECKKLEGQVVIPVFYNIDPSHVRKQLGSYKKAFLKHERDLEHNKDKILKWKTVLSEAANLAGFDSHQSRTDYELIEDLVEDVLQKLNHVYPSSEFRGLVGFHQDIASIHSLLAINSNDVRLIGIWGMGGIGKTTLANAFFEKYSSQYEGRCFLKNVRIESKKLGLDHLRYILVSKLLGDFKICTHEIASSLVMRRLRSKKVFIVLDDVNTLEQLEHLVGKHDCLGLGSRVILTTRDKHMLSGGIDGYHEVKKLNPNESLQLFSLNAFDKSNPEMQYEELSARVVNYAKGVPLALKVLGSFFRSKSEDEWKSAMKKLKKIPNKEIQSVLRLSYDELDDEEKEIFLDIACFMKGWNKNCVKRVLDGCGFFADIGMRNLVDKALITFSNHDTVEVHDLIQEMGREIVRQESIKEIGRRSRLWDPEEVCHVLRNKRGTDAIEGIVLDAYEFEYLNLEYDVFRKMINLRFLIFDAHWGEKFNLHIPSDIESLPDSLRYLHWRGFPAKSLPSTFHPEKLVVLHMPDSQVEKLWDGVQNLVNLDQIMLCNSPNLLELPNLSRATNLKSMFLRGCTSLRDVPSSILSLPKLEVLFLTDCKALRSLRSNNYATSLTTCFLNGCSSLQEFSVTSENLKVLNLAFTAIDELPPSVLLLKKLELFIFHVSESLNKLPDNLVQILNLSNCCHHDLSTLRIILDSLWYLKMLILDNCTLTELPDNINQLVSLNCLSLKQSHLVRLPENIKHLSMLVYLGLYKCEKLQSLPELPLLISTLDVRNCISLEILAGSGAPPRQYLNRIFLFENCIKLDQHALDSIAADAYVRIWVANCLLPALATEEQKEEKGNLYDQECVQISICLPGNKLPYWFSYCSTQPFLTVEIPSYSEFCGFAFCIIIPKAESDPMDTILNLGCECCFLGNNGETITIYESWFRNDDRYEDVADELKLVSDHVYIWYDRRHCHQIMDAVKHSRTGCNMNFSFTFLVEIKSSVMPPYEVSNEKNDIKMAVMIRSCGVEPIYASEDLLAKVEEGIAKSSRSMESDELKLLPKITRKTIIPTLSSGNRKHGEEEA